MKMKNIALVSVVAMGMGMASFANAAPGGNGTVTFVGSIVDAPCSIAPESLDQTVNLGAVSNAVLEANGRSTPVPFQIQLEDCQLPAAGTPSTVTVTFTGAASTLPGITNKLGMIGTAAGAYIDINTVDGASVDLNQASDARTFAAGPNTLSFMASLASPAGTTVTPGSFQVPANFVLNYQ
ncbi:TPA: fimbrial protein [Aeromonas hydrophila]|nr:fimbrial protein [Aeromonas hydrophila]